MWTIGGVKAAPGEELSYVTLAGCWGGGQVARATASKGVVSVDAKTGVVKVASLSDTSLPLTVTVTYKVIYKSA